MLIVSPYSHLHRCTREYQKQPIWSKVLIIESKSEYVMYDAQSRGEQNQ
jgi:hypothetical protein